MKKILISVVLLLGVVAMAAAKSPLKPRMVVLTDISTWETDDSESLVRLLSHADLFEIEAIIFTTGWSLTSEVEDEFFGLIHRAIDAYERDLPNLSKRSGGRAIISCNTPQRIGDWPSAEYLRGRTVWGSRFMGLDKIGKDNSSAGSEMIIRLVDEDDERPLWITVWGGANTLAQAIWEVKNSRTEDELKKFLAKVPTYAITDQDRDQRTPYDISSQYWLREEFSDDMLFIWDECAWIHQNDTGRENWDSFARDIQPKGHLGAQYPKYKWGVEGDTPAFLHIIPNGLSDPMTPTQASWGGYNEFALTRDSVTMAYTNGHGEAYHISRKYLDHFYDAQYNNFVARMDWAENGEGNINPVIYIGSNCDYTPIEKSVKAGRMVELSAKRSYDPDGDGLNFSWWIMEESGSYRGEVEVITGISYAVGIRVPVDAKSGDTIHVICEVSDSGTPSLTSYRRVILEVK